MEPKTETLQRLYDNALPYFDMPEFDVFVKDLQDDNNLSNFRESMSEYYDMPEIKIMKSDLFEIPEVKETGEKDTAIERIFGKNEVTDFFGDIARAWTQGVEQAKTVDPSLDIFYEGNEATDEEVLKFVEANKNLAKKNI
jgi:hypothetical protein